MVDGQMDRYIDKMLDDTQMEQMIARYRETLDGYVCVYMWIRSELDYMIERYQLMCHMIYKYRWMTLMMDDS